MKKLNSNSPLKLTPQLSVVFWQPIRLFLDSKIKLSSTVGSSPEFHAESIPHPSKEYLLRPSRSSDALFRNVSTSFLLKTLVKYRRILKKTSMSVKKIRKYRASAWSNVAGDRAGSPLALSPLLKQTQTVQDVSTLSYGRSFGSKASSIISRSLLAKGPHIVLSSQHYSPKSPSFPTYIPNYSAHQINMRRLRLRFERWFFSNLGCRTYVWFANIWKTLRTEFDRGCLSSMYSRCVRQLTRRGNRFILRANQAYVTFQSIVLAVVSVPGLQFYMKMVIRLLKEHRSHWAVLMYMLTFFSVCKNHFWFKTVYQYRLVVRGKFGGYMRASQKVFQQGVVKIHQWDLRINYYRLCPVTKYGVFSVRFWLQMRDMRQVRLAAILGDAAPSNLLEDYLGKGPIDN